MAEQAKSGGGISNWLKQNPDQAIPWAILGSLFVVLLWAYWNSLEVAAAFWDNPKYSHGWLVPLFTIILLWMRYEPFGPVSLAARWTGIALLSAALGLRLLVTWYPSRVPELDSFVPAVAGLFLLVGGWKMIRWAGPAIAFLVFMFPLPNFLDAGLLSPLQKLATLSSTYCLQTIGIPSYSEGNRIVIGEVQLGVVDACSGLRMLTIFVALAVAITLVTDRPIWERIVIVLSAVPIALTVNIVRITVTGILHLTVGPELADRVFHDLAGWVMMPMALGLLYVEFQILSHLIIEEGPTGPLQIGPAAVSSGRGPAPLAKV
jgi:exosortase